MKLTKENIKKVKGQYKPKAILVLVDELSEVMNDSNFKMVSSIQNSLGSIARLGRAAGCHLCLATQRPSSNVINADLKNNIQMGCLLGDFDSGAATLIFDKDISALSKPEIKGRGFIKSGKDIIEFQSYWTEKNRDFVKKELKSIEHSVTKETLDIYEESTEPDIGEKQSKIEHVEGASHLNLDDEQMEKDRHYMLEEMERMKMERKKDDSIDKVKEPETFESQKVEINLQKEKPSQEVDLKSEEVPLMNEHGKQSTAIRLKKMEQSIKPGMKLNLHLNGKQKNEQSLHEKPIEHTLIDEKR